MWMRNESKIVDEKKTTGSQSVAEWKANAFEM